MIDLGFANNAEKTAFRDTLTNGYEMRIRVQSTNLEGVVDADLTNRVLDGQVNVDASADVTRTLSLSLLDVNNTLSFDSDAPTDAALYMDRMIAVWYGVRTNFPSGTRWVDVPIFRGPITSLSRTGVTVEVEAQGKELLSMGSSWKPMTVRKGQTKVFAIRRILRERGGETRFDMPKLPGKLKAAVVLNREAIPWIRAKRVARSLGGRQLYYDGRGAVRLRVRPAKPVLEFTDRSMLTELNVSYQQGETVNCVFVRGGVPQSGKKVQITAEVFPNRNHPLSPWRLGRNGVPRYLMAVVEDENIRSLAEAKRVGIETLSRGLAQGIDASFDCLPFPHLEPGDLVRVLTDQGSVTFRLRTFSIPLVAGNPMSVGWQRNLRRPKAYGRRAGRIKGPAYTMNARTAELKAAQAAHARRQVRLRQEKAMLREETKRVEALRKRIAKQGRTKTPQLTKMRARRDILNKRIRRRKSRIRKLSRT